MLLKELVLNPKVNDMWYFVEKNGRCISKHKVLVSARLCKMQVIKSGVDTESLKITDDKGIVYK